MNSLYKFGKVLNQVKSHKVLSICFLQSRSAALYGPSNLGVDKYSQSRDEFMGRMSEVVGNFRSKMNDFMKEGSTNMVFTEDLKNMLHLCSKSDVDLLKKMMKKYNAQNREMRFGTYIFGPVVMRAYYYLDLPKEAYNTFKDPELAGFFDQLMSYHILMDLLYKHDMYDEVLDIYEYVKNKESFINRFPKHILVLTMAALYKQNTKESFERAVKIWTEIQETPHQPMRRAGTFLAGLALNQGQPHVALEILATQTNQNYFVIKNLKIHALSELNRPDDAFPIIRSVLEYDGHRDSSVFFIQEVIEHLQAAVERSGNNDHKREFMALFKALNERNMMDTKENTNDLLCKEMIMSQPLVRSPNNRNNLSQSFTYKHPRNPAYNDQPRGQSRSGITDRY